MAKYKMGKAEPMPIGLDDLRNRSKKPPKPGTRPAPLTPRTPGNKKPGLVGIMPVPKPGNKKPGLGINPPKKRGMGR